MAETRIALSILVASSGRPSLSDTLASIASQMRAGDQLIVDVNNDAPWGHAARNRMMRLATGTALMFIDDDDRYLPGAFETVRCELREHPDQMHIFRLRYPNGFELPPVEGLWMGNVSTQIIVVPNDPDRLGTWDESAYEGDYAFIESTVHRMGYPIWHRDVIVAAR